MPPLGPRNHRITVQDAAAHTRRHREAIRTPHEIHSGAYHRDQVRELLQQPGCSGIRIYLGRDARGGSVLVLVGVDAAGEDMTSGTILEEGLPCPPFCPTASPLNA